MDAQNNVHNVGMGKCVTAEQKRSADIAILHIESVMRSPRTTGGKISALFKVSDQMEAKARQLKRQRQRAPLDIKVRIGHAVSAFDKIGGHAVMLALQLDWRRARRIMLAKLSLRREVRRMDAGWI